MVYNNRCERGCQKWHPFCVSLRLIENEYQLFGGMPVWQKKIVFVNIFVTNIVDNRGRYIVI